MNVRGIGTGKALDEFQTGLGGAGDEMSEGMVVASLPRAEGVEELVFIEAKVGDRLLGKPAFTFSHLPADGGLREAGLDLESPSFEGSGC